MNIIISNKFGGYLKTLNIEVIKELNGVYSADDIIRQLENIYYDKVIFDISALKDNMDFANIQKLSTVLDMSKVILVIDNTKYFSTQEFVSKIISIGIYNFTKNIDGVKYLLEHPNSYKDVMKYHKVDATVSTANQDNKAQEQKSTYVPPKKYTTIEDVYASNVLTPAEKEKLVTKMRMQETVKKAKLGGENSTYVRKKKSFFRIILSFILPIMAVGLTYLYYFLLYNMGDWIEEESSVGKILFMESVDGGPSIVALLLLILMIIIMNIVYSIVKARIRAIKSSYAKFSIIPFGIFTVLINLDKYFGEFLSNIIKFGDGDIKGYMIHDIYGDFRLISTLMVIIYFTGLLFQSAKTLEFEQEISRNSAWYEKLYIFVLLVSVFLPGFHYLFDIFTMIQQITDFFDSIYSTGLMQIITIVDIVGLIALIVVEIVKAVKLKNFSSIEEKPKEVKAN